MLQLKDDNNRYTSVDGRYNRNNITIIKSALGKKRDCKTVRQGQLIASQSSLHQALSDGFNTLCKISIRNGLFFVDKNVNIKLPACIADAMQLIDKITADAGYQF